jgi:hypothetical protein
MEKKNDSTILLLLLAGFGVYWLTKKKPTTAAVTIPADQGNISTQPVIEQPITAQPVMDIKAAITPISTQPVYEQPIYVAPTIEQPAQSGEFTPMTDMFNTVWQTNYVDKSPIDAVYNMNIQPIE